MKIIPHIVVCVLSMAVIVRAITARSKRPHCRTITLATLGVCGVGYAILKIIILNNNVSMTQQTFQHCNTTLTLLNGFILGLLFVLGVSAIVISKRKNEKLTKG